MERNPLEKLGDLPESHQELFLALASALADAEPWLVCPPDVPLGLRLPEIELADARVVVIGQGEEAYGLLLFHNAFAHRRFTDVVEEEPGAEARMPRYGMLTFDAFTPEGGEPMIIPSLSVFDDGDERPPDVMELDQLLASMQAVTAFVSAHKGSRALAWVWEGGPAVESQVEIEVNEKPMHAKVRAPAVGYSL